MSTDLTTTISLKDDMKKEGFRLCRTSDAGLRVYSNEGLTALYFSEDDAIMLRDWLNDEWPVMQAEPADGCCQAEPDMEGYANMWGVNLADKALGTSQREPDAIIRTVLE